MIGTIALCGLDEQRVIPHRCWRSCTRFDHKIVGHVDTCTLQLAIHCGLIPAQLKASCIGPGVTQAHALQGAHDLVIACAVAVYPFGEVEHDSRSNFPQRVHGVPVKRQDTHVFIHTPQFTQHLRLNASGIDLEPCACGHAGFSIHQQYNSTAHQRSPNKKGQIAPPFFNANNTIKSIT